MDFADIVYVKRPLVLYQEIKDPYWLAGFTSAELNFIVKINANKTFSLGFQVQLEFKLTQHVRDEQLMNSLIKFLDCGKLDKDKTGNRNWLDFKVTKFDDITQKIIPFFKKHSIHGVKSKDFADWCKVAKLVENKSHLTQEGLKQIPWRHIKVGMNKGRKS